jgi:hypothetical protein
LSCRKEWIEQGSKEGIKTSRKDTCGLAQNKMIHAVCGRHQREREELTRI